MIRIIVIAYLLFFNSLLFAQVKVKGKLIDAKNRPIELAEVLILDKDSVAIKSEISSSNGDFTLYAEAGSYLLQVKQAGNILWAQKMNIIHDIDLGNIEVFETKEKLSEVVIKTKKKILERKVDRLIFSVENSVSAAGGDAIDALRITPSIKVQEDQIAMIGKKTMSVMVDDRLIQLSGEDLITFLKTIQSDNIKSIEVITTPPAKYDAEGNSGIVNILLKKAKKNSWLGTFRNASVLASNFSGTTGGDFLYQKDKLDISTSISGTIRKNVNTNSPNAYFTEETWNQEVYTRSSSKNISGNFQINYQLTPKTKIGAFYNGFNFSGDDYQRNKNLMYSTSDDLTKYYHSTGDSNIKSYNNTANLNLTHKLDTLGKQISVDIDYFKRNQNKDNPFYTINEDYKNSEVTNYYTYNSGNQIIDNFSFKADFDAPYSWANLNYGAKISFTKTKNDALGDFYEIISGENQLYLNQINDFEYVENNQAFYISAQHKFQKKWDIKLGLRAEATYTKGTSEPENLVNTNNYIKFFPSAFISYNLNSSNNFNINYSRRIQRPAYWELNPARWYTNLNFINYGNPFLQPSFSHNIELNHSYKNKLNSGLWFSITKAESGQLTINQDENTILSIRENFANTLSAGWTEYFSFNVFPWWSLTNSLNVFYAENSSTSIYLKSYYSGWGGDINSISTFSLNKEKTFNAELTYFYDFPNKYAYDTREGRSYLNLGFKYGMLNKKLQMNLLFRDLFRSYKTVGTRNTQTTLYTFNIYNDSQSVRFSINYTFGNKSINVSKRQGGNTEESNRAN
ncbi:outer membrane beta-barrel family protein [Flavobacterium gelatinilyticum]|uniref:outer membrane beta-barrel family protein n=1 Tax=Flavobacterium gelatinilyticum TaxID=3003260 RepID=UPI0024813E62|nr:outer membrane beta-barrel family protein [Flavobacterium gelatinilyticum]